MALKRCMVLFYACGTFAASAQDAPSRPAFEVASIKPAVPNADLQNAPAALQERIRESRYNSRPPGWLQMDKARITIRDQSLLEVVATAYRVRTSQVSGPAWMAEVRFDIEAKIPEGASTGSANEMLQSLLAERFGLQLHRDEKELAGYVLLVGKNGPKLKAAEAVPAAEERPNPEEMKKQMEGRMKEMQATMEANRAQGLPGGGESSSGWGKKDATIAEVAAQLSRTIRKPVVDMTSLDGKYDVRLDLRWSTDGGPESAASQAVAAMGLKLEARKLPTTIFVVDKISKTPTEN